VFPTAYLAEPAFFNDAMWIRAARIWIHVALFRCKYYFGWYLAEAAFVASGYGYNGKDAKGEMKWDRATNSYPLRVEFPANIRDVANNWNIHTSLWLRHYIYERFPTYRKESMLNMLPTMTVYTVSAFWHGFYPGYYMFFLYAAFLTEIARISRRKVRPHFVKKDDKGKEVPIFPWKPCYDFVGFVLGAWPPLYAGVGFALLAAGPTLAVQQSLYFVGHWGAVVVFLVLNMLPTPREEGGGKSRRDGSK